MKKIVMLFTAAFTSLATASGLAADEPGYRLVKEEKPFALREYPPLLIAEVTVGGNRNEAANTAFRILAGFIFGKNTARGKSGSDKIAMTAPVTQRAPSEKIAMTAPVTQEKTGGGWTVAFIMPEKYTAKTLPVPNDERIVIRQVPARRMAVVTFSGVATDASIAKNRKELEAFIAARKLKPRGDAEIAYYDPPFKPGFLRRNEVMIPVK